MAINNEDKRRSAPGFPGRVLPVPDNDVDEGDRAQVAHVYRDFDFDEPPSGGGRGGRHLLIALHHV